MLGHNYPGSDWYQDSYALMTTAGVQVPESEAEAAIRTCPTILKRMWNSIF